MNAGKYKVLPFLGKTNNKLTVAQQLESLLEDQAALGWELVQVENVKVEHPPSCWGGLMGRGSQYFTTTVVVLQRR